mgnify:FL=1
MSHSVKCLISAGPTREWIDSVRYISNPSTGKMGYALASIAKSKRFEVTLVSGPVEIEPPEGVKFFSVESAIQMHEVLLSEMIDADLIIMSAAVSDHRPEYLGAEKVKKNDFPSQLKLIRNPDILSEICKIKRSNQTVVGFAAETSNLLENAREKLISKNLDWVVINDVSKKGRGFGTDTNEVTLLSKLNKCHTIPLGSKMEIATGILNKVWK